jgi:pimeloyl-ACP methyl ester carboxylesterase
VTLRVDGTGPAIVVVQGGPGLTSRSVAPIADLLQDSFRVIRFDHACGTVADLLHHMDAVRSDLGEESWFVLGHSWGAVLAALYARNHPDRVHALVLAHPLEISSAFCDLASDASGGFDDHFSQDHDADVAEMLWEDLEALCPDTAGEGYDLAPVVRQITVPALVILGQHDAIDPRSGRLWAELTKADLISMPDAGHWSFLEQPREFQRTVTAFLSSNGTRRAMAAFA